MRPKKLNLLAILAAANGVLCQDVYNHASSGFGDGRNLTQSPNASVSAPVNVGNQQITLTLDVTEIVPDDDEPSDFDNPRIAYSQFSLEWPGDKLLRDQLRESEGLSDDEAPVLCATFALGLFGTGPTNAYEDDGDCSGPLGNDCLDALTSQTRQVPVNWTNLSSVCSPFFLPDACSDKFPEGGLGTGVIVYPRSFHDGDPTLNPLIRQPYDFAFRNSKVYEAGDTTAYERATEQLQVMILSGAQTNVSCLRVKSDRVSNGDPAVSESSAERLLDQTWRFALLGAAGAVIWHATAM